MFYRIMTQSNAIDVKKRSRAVLKPSIFFRVKSAITMDILWFFPLKHDDEHESFIVCYNCSDTYIICMKFSATIESVLFFSSMLSIMFIFFIFFANTVALSNNLI